MQQASTLRVAPFLGGASLIWKASLFAATAPARFLPSSARVRPLQRNPSRFVHAPTVGACTNRVLFRESGRVRETEGKNLPLPLAPRLTRAATNGGRRSSRPARCGNHSIECRPCWQQYHEARGRRARLLHRAARMATKSQTLAASPQMIMPRSSQRARRHSATVVRLEYSSRWSILAL